MSESTFKAVNSYLKGSPNAAATDRDTAQKVLTKFVAQNEDPKASPNFAAQGGDDMKFLIKLARHPAVDENAALGLLILKTFKILSRKHDNRIAFGAEGIRSVVRFLSAPLNTRIAGEGANVILNICYEKDNVEHVLKSDGVIPLVAFLETPDLDLQANAAGAIQSICFQEQGRISVRECNAIPAIIKLLDCDNQKVQTRAVGAVHNMSSDPEAIRTIRRKNGIPHLIRLLSSEASAICGSAAGALQNVSREVASRQLIRDGGAVPPLSALLFGTDMQAQVCAAGALLNILGPELGENQKTGARKGFGKILSLCLVVGMAYECLFDESSQSCLYDFLDDA
ncbi:hypothetical protein CYMTET_17011 [Cymbomonas tetramitiformis]|uniref:Uncharacterized protein n=1 Tax=Cymbomonas tetramitiformis TaxID=36881 RepID=A0AAE0GB99_9CHLO|nr:hypothetical protein CYMTET_17011 [Cymbomonas tetramitiformis]